LVAGVATTGAIAVQAALGAVMLVMVEKEKGVV
jgi:hypothetical protein